MNAPSTDIKDMLEAVSALGLTLSTNLFTGKEPAKPDNTVTIFDTPGFPPQVTLGVGDDDYYYPSVQIRVRNRDYLTGLALIQDILTSLHGRAQETWNGTLYTVILCSSGPVPLGWDENDRIWFIINFNLQRR